MSSDSFLEQISGYISKAENFDKRTVEPSNSLNCHNTFDLEDKYSEEKCCIHKIESGNFKSSKDQGDILEKLTRSLFSRIDLISSFSRNDKETALGQIDINLMPVDNVLFDMWGMFQEYPTSIIGECKHYVNGSVSRPDIEKTCWRACKGRSLSFFIGTTYTQPALAEAGYFNRQRGSIFNDSKGVLIVPITLDMIKTVVANNLNFSYFIKWAILASRNMAIANYL